AFSKSNVNAIINGLAGSHRNLHRTKKQGCRRMDGRGIAENVVKEDCGLARLDPNLSLGRHQAIGDLCRENVWCNQFVKRRVVFVAQADRPARVGFGENPFEGHQGVENVFHWLSRSSRTIWTAFSCSPKGCRFSSRSRSMRSQACFAASGSRIPCTS